MPNFDPDAGLWRYDFSFDDCDIGEPIREFFDENATPTNLFDDVEFSTYTVFLNFDAAISDELGYGNLKQLKPAKIKCRIPTFVQENNFKGVVSIEEESYSVPDENVDYKISDHIQLSLFSGGVDLDPTWGEQPLGEGDTGRVVKSNFTYL